MRIKRLSQNFVSNWLLGTAIFVMGWSVYLSYAIGTAWLFMGWMGGMVMLFLLMQVESKEDFKPFSQCIFWGCLLSLLVIAIKMALASQGICLDAFGLLS